MEHRDRRAHRHERRLRRTSEEFGEVGSVEPIGGALEASMNETIAMLESISGRTLDVRRRQPAVPGDQRRTQADTTRIRGELGWLPRVSLEEGLTRQWEWASARVAAE